MTARLASGLWVAAYLQRLQAAAIPAYVLRRGDDTAGEVLVKLATLDGQARAYARQWDLGSDARRWVVMAEGEERAVDATLAREAARDPDLWLIEVEDRAGRTLLEEDGLRDG